MSFHIWAPEQVEENDNKFRTKLINRPWIQMSDIEEVPSPRSRLNSCFLFTSSLSCFASLNSQTISPSH